MVDGVTEPSMSYLVPSFNTTRRAVKTNFQDDEVRYQPVWNLVDKRWENYFKAHLVNASDFLNIRMFYKFLRYQMDRRIQVRNFPHQDHPFCLDNMDIVSPPAEYITNNIGRNSGAFSNSNLRSNVHLPLNFLRDTPYSRVSNSASSQPAHQTHHLQPSPNSNGILRSYVQHSPSPYHRQMFAIHDGLAINTQQDNQRLPSKRKHRNISTTYETVNSNGFHTGATSSQNHVPSGIFNQNSMSGFHFQPWEHNNISPSNQPNSLIETEGWQRNVMSRPNTSLDVHRSITGSHLPNINSIHPDQDRREWSLFGNHLTFNQQMPSGQFHRSGDFHSQIPGQQIHNSHRGSLTSGSGAFSCETSQPFVQHSSRFMMEGRPDRKVNKLSSTKTQLPYDFYFLNYCKPSKIMNSAENLGEILRGDRIENSVYSFNMRMSENCKVACRVKLDDESAKRFKHKIDNQYRVNMILDNLPIAVLRHTDGTQPSLEHGFFVGYKKDSQYFIHNHLKFRVMYHMDPVIDQSAFPEKDDARIVGFEVIPYSVNHEYTNWDDKNPSLVTCNPGSKFIPGTDNPQQIDKDEEIIFTYDVSFVPSDVKWASRWDTYLLMNDEQIHWFSIINSLMIVLFLSGMVAMIMLRTLYRDIAYYNQLETQDDAQEETGWKLVHGDVFRPPARSELLCVYVGTGIQLFGMAVVTMIFALLGFLSPSNRGGLMTAMVLLWVFMGLFAGYSSSRLHKMFKGTNWKNNSLRTALLFPAVIFCIFFVLNALIWGEKSSGAVPFGTMFALVFLWFGISVPLVFIGGYVGIRKSVIDDPVKTTKIPRQIPEQAWFMKPIFSILIGGVLPFGAVFIELFFILTSIWLNQFYYIFGFLFIVFVILLITCAEITVVLCYFQLCSEDYNWWWRAYFTAGSSALYIFLYSVFYFFTKLEITHLVSGILYFGYMLIVSYAFFVMIGTVGFYACFWFVRKIYSSVKIE